MKRYNITSRLNLDALASATADAIVGGQTFDERSLYPLSRERGKLVVTPAEEPVVGLFPIAYIRASPQTGSGYEMISNDVIVDYLVKNGSVDTAEPTSSGDPNEILDELEYLSILSAEAFRQTADRN